MEFSKAEKEKFMALALTLAKKGLLQVSPNPAVGAVLVLPDGRIFTGLHERFGAPHAERSAIFAARKSGANLQGAALFCNLEPCCHFGKTPPCTDAILQAGISQVFVGTRDPHEQVAGRGLRTLRENGVKVETGLLRKQCEKMNEIFFHFARLKIPFVATKIATNFQWQAGLAGQRVQISGEKSQEFSHTLRQRFDAILVGANTVRVDDPHLGVRTSQLESQFENAKRDPLRVIFDRDLQLTGKFKVFRDENFLLCTKRENEKRAQKIFPPAKVVAFATQENGHFAIPAVLQALATRRISSLLVEGGVRVFQSFLQQGAVQESFFILRDKALRQENAMRIFTEKFPAPPTFKLEKIHHLEKDCILAGRFKAERNLLESF